jgi:hypothetical protein
MPDSEAAVDNLADWDAASRNFSIHAGIDSHPFRPRLCLEPSPMREETAHPERRIIFDRAARL